jgi:hypothetical protein
MGIELSLATGMPIEQSKRRHVLTKWLGGGAAAIILIAVEFWLIHAGHDALAATILSLSIGFVVVMYQIGTQARNALKQSREIEAVKLKLEVYKDIIAISRDASTAVGDFASLIDRFHSALLFAQQTQTHLNAYVIPTSSGDPQLFIDARAAMSRSAIKLMALTETWQMINPRVDIFRKAINAALFDIDMTYEPYFNAALHAMPLGVPRDPPKEGAQAVSWHPPSAEVIQQIGTLGNTVTHALRTLQSYVFDFQKEMQTHLLGELFPHTIPPRTPIDPKAIVIRLDRYDELSSYFDRQSNWGREQERIKNELRQNCR